ncbi:DUF6356 family protein [Sphingomonas bacterium]|uniref:DUF6356 family protein n=1 Tax=Sphingomonas bacterium TaxID=1895847 RepID=UPI0015766EA7|nr:DUF6356 family protein [Sphingomonas bacterium]
MIERLFLAHPRSVGESYFQHLRVAGRVGVMLIGGGIACLIHAIFPQLHVRTGSRTIFRLNAELKGRQPTEAELNGAALTWDI